VRAKATSPLAEVWRHGKLLYALLLERRMRRQLGDTWGRLTHERLATWWRVWGLLKGRHRPHDYRSVVLEERCLSGMPEGVGRTTAPKERTTASF
jgi:hypothetical protein